jgi:SNF2 family DNA or RNA helicase
MISATLTDDGRFIAVDADYRDKDRITAIPGVRRVDSRWILPLSWASCLRLRGVFGAELEVQDPLNAWARNEKTVRITPASALRDAMDHTHPDERLRSYQRAGVAWLNTVGSALLADDMGSGKTVQITRALADRGSGGLPALVVCPKSMKRVWSAHVPVWAPGATPYVVDGTATKCRSILAAAREDPTAVVLVTIQALRQYTRLAPFGSMALRKCRECDPHFGEENLRTAQCETHHKELNDFAFRTVVFDEIHAMGDHRSKQTRAAWHVAHNPSVDVVWGLSATVMPDNLGNLWSVMHTIAPDEYPSRSKWMDRYAHSRWNAFGGQDIIGIKPETREEFQAILDLRMRRMPKAMILPDLPPIVRVVRHVTMTPKQKKTYDAIASQMMTRLDDGNLLITPDNLNKHTRMLQLSSSYGEIVWDDPDDPDGWHVQLKEPSPKVDEVLSILEEIGPNRQVAVCAVSRPLVEMLAARLEKAGITHSVITGAVNEAAREYELNQFQSGARRVLVFTVGAGGTGLTMTAADTLIFMQRSYRMIDNIQSEGRVHRIGSERHESVTIVDIVAVGTVEETDQIPRLTEKMERLEEINRDRERLRAAGLDTSTVDREVSLIHSSLV